MKPYVRTQAQKKHSKSTYQDLFDEVRKSFAIDKPFCQFDTATWWVSEIWFRKKEESAECKIRAATVAILLCARTMFLPKSSRNTEALSQRKYIWPLLCGDAWNGSPISDGYLGRG